MDGIAQQRRPSITTNKQGRLMHMGQNSYGWMEQTNEKPHRYGRHPISEHDHHFEGAPHPQFLRPGPHQFRKLSPISDWKPSPPNFESQSPRMSVGRPVHTVRKFERAVCQSVERVNINSNSNSNSNNIRSHFGPICLCAIL